jgi:hypothetical protein
MLTAGSRLRPQDIGIAAAVVCTRLAVALRSVTDWSVTDFQGELVDLLLGETLPASHYRATEVDALSHRGRRY